MGACLEADLEQACGGRNVKLGGVYLENLVIDQDLSL